MQLSVISSCFGSLHCFGSILFAWSSVQIASSWWLTLRFIRLHLWSKSFPCQQGNEFSALIWFMLAATTHGTERGSFASGSRYSVWTLSLSQCMPSLARSNSYSHDLSDIDSFAYALLNKLWQASISYLAISNCAILDSSPAHLVATYYRLQVWSITSLVVSTDGFAKSQAPALYGIFELKEAFKKRIQERLCAHIWYQHVDSSDESCPSHSRLHTAYLWKHYLRVVRNDNASSLVTLHFGADFHFWCKATWIETSPDIIIPSFMSNILGPSISCVNLYAGYIGQPSHQHSWDRWIFSSAREVNIQYITPFRFMLFFRWHHVVTLSQCNAIIEYGKYQHGHIQSFSNTSSSPTAELSLSIQFVVTGVAGVKPC